MTLKPSSKGNAEGMRRLANENQSSASDPYVSAFVSASAGSGKTKLLVDRLLRLMLPIKRDDQTWEPGTNPARIQCLTFTRAAAAEMALRLQTKLAEWISVDDNQLNQELGNLGVEVTNETRVSARALFGQVLDLPGGMRIETIHSFCQSLLKRFPLEAHISPYFSVLEEGEVEKLIGRVFENVLMDAGEDELREICYQHTLDKFSAILKQIHNQSSHIHAEITRWIEDPRRLAQDLAKIFQVHPEDTEDDIIGKISEHRQIHNKIRSHIEGGQGKSKTTKTQANILEWLNLNIDDRKARCEHWRKIFLKKDFERKKIISSDADYVSLMEEEGDYLLRMYDWMSRVSLYRLNKHMMGLVLPTLIGLKRSKQQQGLLEHNDLISYSRLLLQDLGAAWVLYKLDGSIDHLLLDEVQDTSGVQWEIAAGLTEEFFSGSSAREDMLVPRTIFAVGDFKQSIYSFQGAEPRLFHVWRKWFATRVQNAGLKWCKPELTVSFRSATPILDFVDHVFKSPIAMQGLLEAGEAQLLPHKSARTDNFGRVEIWPLVPQQELAPKVNPWVPDKSCQYKTILQPEEILAHSLAITIKQQLGLDSHYSVSPPIRPRDIMILVRKKSRFVTVMIKALRYHGIPTANLVSQRLSDHVAVRDLLILCEVLLLPEDDLTLSCFLTSPLGGINDESLMKLIIGRSGTVWDTLKHRADERSDWNFAFHFIRVLQKRVDFASPYELLSEALGELGGRTRLYSRLGGEAEEPVNEILEQALEYERLHVPSLQGFVHWVRHSDRSVRREPDTASDVVRVMTVYLSKGLQAKQVILADTMRDEVRDNKADTLFWYSSKKSQEIPLWVPRRDMHCSITAKLKKEFEEERRLESHRLLYVALTRACDRLLICGWQSFRSGKETWYDLCHKGALSLGFERVASDLPWAGDKLLFDNFPPTENVQQTKERSYSDRLLLTSSTASLPAWIGKAPHWFPSPLREEADISEFLTPSRPNGVGFGSYPSALSPLTLYGSKLGTIQARGKLVHTLLQYLPTYPRSQWEKLVAKWLGNVVNGLSLEDQLGLSSKILAILRHKDLIPLFASGSLAEQPLTGRIGNKIITGQVDRMAVTDDSVWLADYKTGTAIPDKEDEVPPFYLRQMASYRVLLQEIYPDKVVYPIIIWVDRPSVTFLSTVIMDKYHPQM